MRVMAMKDFGSLIFKLRNEKGMSQDDLANLLGCKKQTISNYERNTRKPSYETLEAIADVLNVPIGFFLSDEERESKLNRIYKTYNISGGVGSESSRETCASQVSSEAEAIARAYDNLNRAGRELIMSAMAFATKHHAQRHTTSNVDVPLPRIGTVNGVPLFQMPDDRRLPMKEAALEELKELSADAEPVTAE
jgi:transcriptional regulator with XRE-family HTH domain